LGNHALSSGYELRENNSTVLRGYSASGFTNFRHRSANGWRIGSGALQATSGANSISGGAAGKSGDVRPAHRHGGQQPVISRITLAGSVSSINQQYWLTQPENTTWSDYRNEHEITTPLHQTRNVVLCKVTTTSLQQKLTINLGMRWEYTGVPYNTRGIHR
jgi:hypothetical protein